MNNNLVFLKLNKNEKTPIKNIKFTDKKHQYKISDINTNFYNVGLLAGENNLIMLDIDVNNDGLNEWEIYLKNNSEPLTVCQRTKSGGLHYVFKEISNKYTNEEVELINRLKNKAGYRNKGLDIRKNNGYIVVEPSTIDNNKYEFIRHYNKFEILEIPLSILKWLLEFENDQEQNNLKLLVDDEQDIIILLDSYLSTPRFYDNGREWLKITTCLKGLYHEFNSYTEKGLKKIWDKWSRQSTEKYNKEDNFKIWDEIKITMNFNYYVYQIIKEGYVLKIFKTIKPYTPITKDINNIKQITMNNKFLQDEKYIGEQLSDQIFKDNKTLILQSGTGTGKTSTTAKIIKLLETENNNNETVEKNYKILSIVSRKTLAYQHIESFNKEGLKMVSYEDKKKNIEDDNIIICLNSLEMFIKYNKAFFNNYIVYIDEITTFTRHLTHNETLDRNLKKVYGVLMKIINNCHKLILSEAIINDNVFNICSKRDNKDKIYFINEFQKYKGLQAIKENDENKFLKNVKEHVRDKKYFFFGCDSAKIIKRYYETCLKIDPNNCILVIADEKYIIVDAVKQFKNKYVFYSPSITCGVDFTINETQDVFIYMKGDTIEPCDSFQQATRTRNINKLFYFIDSSNDDRNYKPKYNSINECEETFKEIAYTHKILSNICIIINEDDEAIFNENSFFKLFVYNEYLIDIYKSNKARHFQEILKNNGFILEDTGNKFKVLRPDILKKMKATTIINTNIKFCKHINEIEINENYDDIMAHLNIRTDEEKRKYKMLITDKYQLTDYYNTMKLFNETEILKKKLIKLDENNVEYKAIYTNINKILLIRELEKEANIGLLDLDFKLDKEPINISNKLLKQIQIAFRTTAKAPKTKTEFYKYYTHKLLNITGDIKLFKSSRIQVNKERIYKYSFNEETLKFYFELNYLKYPLQNNGIIKEILERFKEIIPINNEEDILFLDDDEINIKIDDKEEDEIIDPLDQ